MNENEVECEDLRERFLSPPNGAAQEEGCPPPEQFLKAALGELSVAENRSLADHSAVCPSCTVAWKLAREYAQEAALGVRTPQEEIIDRRWRTPLRWAWVPAAAGLAAVFILVTLFVPWRGDHQSTVPVLRTLGQERIESRVPGVALPRDGFTLRWSAGPEGTRYDIRVTDRRLEQLAQAVSLDRPEFTVPATALADLERGSPVLWQVESALPDGRRIVSQTFATRLE